MGFKYALFFVVMVGAIGGAVLFGLDAQITQISGSPEYQAGYNTGYVENNESKYQAACNLTDHFSSCTEKQYDYAKGYRRGYRQKQDELKQNELKNETNNSLELLGI